MYLTEEPIDLSRFFAAAPPPDCGAVTTFSGFVRDHDRGRRVAALFYECYPSMADRRIAALITQAEENWPVGKVRVIHRVGQLAIGDAAVAIWVAAAHRDAAFAACRFVIEGIKREVPIWKKQTYEDGSSEWAACTHAPAAAR